MKIYIPTRGRATKQITLSKLPEIARANTYLVVPKDEARAYAYPRLMITPREIQGISQVRQWILENAETDKIAILDDDIRFKTRNGRTRNGAWKYATAQPDEIKQLFYLAENLLDNFGHGGIVHPQEGWSTDQPLAFNQRCYDAAFYNLKTINGSASFRLPLMEDFDFTLQLLSNGLPNFQIVDFAIDSGATNTAGGCSLYRDAKMQSNSANQLAALHSNFVTVVTKKTKASWGGGARTDVRVAWSKAYNGAELDKPSIVSHYNELKNQRNKT